MSASDRAAELGTEHGREAAEAWVRSGQGNWALPEPDRATLWRDHYPAFRELFVNQYPKDAVDAYCAAFRAAVELTVRERAGS